MLEVRSSSVELTAPENSLFDRFQHWFLRNDIRLGEFALLAALSILANIYFISNFSLSIDDELAAVRSVPDVWLAQDRFSIYLIEKFLFPQPAIPFSPYLFLAMAQAASYILLVRSHAFRISWKTYAAYPLFITFPAWWAISEFAANVPAIGVGLLSVAVAAYLAHTDKLLKFGRENLIRIVVIISLLTLAAGAYQSLLTMYLAISLGIMLARGLDRSTFMSYRAAQVVKQIIQSGMFLAAAAVLYLLINRSLQNILGIDRVYIDSFMQPGTVLAAPFWFFGNLAKEIVSTYTGSASVYGSSLPAAISFMLAAFVAIVAIRPRAVALHGLLLGGVLVAPFTLHLVTGSITLPVRSMLALAYVVWLLAILMLSSLSRWLLLGAALLCGLYQLQIANLLSQYMANATLSQAFDRMIAQDIGKQILSLETGPDREVIYIDFYGYRAQSLNSIYPSEASHVTDGSFFGWDKGNSARISAYMRILGFGQFQPLDAGARRALTAEFAAMPVWPHPGAVKRHGDIYLVKLGTSADAAHAPIN